MSDFLYLIGFFAVLTVMFAIGLYFVLKAEYHEPETYDDAATYFVTRITWGLGLVIVVAFAGTLV